MLGPASLHDNVNRVAVTDAEVYTPEARKHICCGAANLQPFVTFLGLDSLNWARVERVVIRLTLKLTPSWTP